MPLTWITLKSWASRFRKLNVKVQKIDDSALQTFEIVIIDFQIEDKIGKLWYFQEIFLVANTKVEIILSMPFLKFNNTSMSFKEKTLI